MLWGEFVNMLLYISDVTYSNVLNLMKLFSTPFSEILNADSGLSSIITSIVSWIFSLFGIEFLQLTPLEFMLGSTLPAIVVFTIFRYVKQ